MREETQGFQGAHEQLDPGGLAEAKEYLQKVCRHLINNRTEKQTKLCVLL